MLKRSTVLLGTAALCLSTSLAMSQERGKTGGQGRGGQEREKRGGGGFGQRGGFGGFGGFGLAGLVGIPEVQKEIAVTDEQKGLIDDMMNDLRNSARGGGAGFDFQAFNELSDEEKAKRRADMQKQAEERTKKTDEMISAILEPTQVARLNELRLQQQGVNALDRAEVAAKLELSAEQKEKIAKIREESRGPGGPGGFGGGGQGGQFDREAFTKMMEEARARREKANADILALLTDSQKEAWGKMQGKKFDFPQPQQRRRPD